MPQEVINDTAPAEPSVEVTFAPPEDTESGADAASAPPTIAEDPSSSAPDQTEERARSVGWLPKGEYPGDPKKWRPASEYLEVHERITPIIRKENKTLREENRLMKERLAALEAKEVERSERTEQMSVETLKYEHQQAQERGDYSKAAEIAEKLIDAKVKQAVKPKPAAPTIDPVVQDAISAFEQANDWLSDPRLKNAMAETLFTMRQAGTLAGLSPADALEEAKDRVKRSYPERFGRTRQSTAPSLGETAGNNGHARGGTRTWSDLKPEVRAHYEAEIQADPKVFTKERLLKRFAADPKEYFAR